MILILVRNTLHIPPSNEDLKRTEDDASSHDQVIWALHESGFYNLMLYIASSDSEQHLCMHILEILSKMLKDSNAEDLATAGKLMSASRREESTNSLVKQKLVEDMTKSRKNFKLSTRHSRFGGIYSVKGVKSVGERDATVMKPNFDPGDLSQDQLKLKKPGFGRQIKIQEKEASRKSTLAIRLILRDFCIEFLNSSYNTLLHVVKDNLVRHRTMANDESYYLWAVRFFSQFNRIYGFKLELISETLNVDSFHYVQSCIELYMNNLHTDKRNIDAWNQRMQNAMSTYKELLLSMVAMDNSKEKPCLDLSQHIKSHIFYQMEYRELCLQLLQHYKPFKFSKTFRRDLIESTHIFFKLLEKFAKSNRHIVIQKKKGIRKKSDKKKNKVKHEEKQTEEQISQIWEDMREELEMILGGVVLGVDEAMPFDPASDESMDDQKRTAVKRIHFLLRQRKASEASALFRAARDVWPEGDVFGSPSLSTTEEVDVIKEIFFYEFSEIHQPEEIPEVSNEFLDGNGADFSEEEEEEERHMVAISEQEFDFPSYERRLCNPRIIQALNAQLANYDKETTFTNHATIKLMHRIAWDCNHPAMFFQATLFRTFQRVLRDFKRKVDPAVKEIGQFANFILRKLTEVSKSNKIVFLELLFPKTNRDSIEIEHGYGSSKSEGSKPKSAVWTEEEEFELQQLYDEFKDQTGDVIDMICNALLNQSKSNRQVTKKLKSMGVDIKELRKRSKGHIQPRNEWTENEIIELRDLVQKFIDSQDPLERIVEHLSVRRPKYRVKQKIIDLGFVSDPTALRKKRLSKKGSNLNKKKRIANNFDGLGGTLNEQEVHRREAGDATSEEDSESSSSSDSESDDDHALTPKPFVPYMLKKSKNQKQNRLITEEPRREPTVPFMLDRVNDLLKQLIEKDYQESLKWLVESLEEVVTDREVDEINGIHESVPLVPILEEVQTAFEDELFLELLAAITLGQPILGQEQYWRVPGALSNEELKRRCETIKEAIGEESANSPGCTPLSENGCSPYRSDGRDVLVVNEEAQDEENNRRLLESEEEAENQNNRRKRARIESDSD
ncbi:protein timeless homolog [Artemia franciscana]|uniref:Uncharacterized protein n=1 Tax=Artemia franciscana TaxID=6661 RepID=A0AA88H7H1_ARTSF|nr:hypothetical protein QYM36_017177 [Artemia franciscana]